MPNVGLAGLNLHTVAAGNVAGAQVNWPVGMIVPFVVNDRGPAPGPPIAPFPVILNWMWAGAIGGPIMNIVIHANDFHLIAAAGFHMVGPNAVPYQNLFIINQLQSALLFQ